MYPIANPKVLHRARKILAYDPIFIDTETTGFSPDDVVIEIGVVTLNGETLYQSFFKPTIPIPQSAIDVHHITEDMVESAPSNVMESVSKEAAEDAKSKLEAAGAVVILK